MSVMQIHDTLFERSGKLCRFTITGPPPCLRIFFLASTKSGTIELVI